ncbi:MAG: UbiA family prenyltransferase [Candidatus Altiarchaeota archaeon]|nr:UbiA family prenyltransferase [Candidatus Altiarchaeota archaeon]
MNPYIRLLRLEIWPDFLLVFLFGAWLSSGYPVWKLGLMLVSTAFYLGFGFAINYCCDTQEDSLHKEKSKRNPITNKEIKKRSAYLFSIILAIIGLLITIPLGIPAFLICSLLLSLVYIYSAPPLRLKSRPWLDLISHGLFAGSLPFLFAVVALNTEINMIHYAIAFSLFHFWLISELKQHIGDYESDRAAGLRTTVCILGKPGSEKLLKALVLLLPITMLPVFLSALNYFLILTAGFYVYILKTQDYIKDTRYNAVSYLAAIVFGII